MNYRDPSWRIGCLGAVIGFMLLPTRLPADGFTDTIEPLLTQYCVDCHSTEKQDGDLDLQQFSSIAEVRQQAKLWQNVRDQLESGEMPPVDAEQVSDPQRRQLIGWTEGMLDEVALAHAGDPGPVSLRRLSNMEYTYSIRDLTGVPSLDPAAQFPGDGAAGEGFTNASAALVMSPALLAKYLDAAKEIGNHTVLLPNGKGIRFSSSTSPRDWTQETLTKIREFYARYSSIEAGTSLEVSGVRSGFKSNAGRRLAVRQYIDTLLRNRDKLQNDESQLAAVASAANLNEKYLTILWQALNNEHDSALLADLRTSFANALPKNSGEITDLIVKWQNSLWRFTSVGHIGKPGSPTHWQEPVKHVVTNKEMRLPLTPTPDQSEVLVYLCVSDAGDGNKRDFALWRNLRLVTPESADVLLSDLLPDSLALETGSLSLKSPMSEIEFGRHPVTGKAIDASSVCVQANSTLVARIPSRLLNEGTELVTTGCLDEDSAEGSVQMRLLLTKPPRHSSSTQELLPGTPVIVNSGDKAQARFKTVFREFRELFPIALCYTTIVPIDEVVTLKLYHREDDHLKRLMLSDQESAELDGLWNELHFVSQSPIKQVDAFEQLYQFSTQNDVLGEFVELREPLEKSAADFRQAMVANESTHVRAAIDFAQKAWRRPLDGGERETIRDLYRELRDQELSHDMAIRTLLTRVLTSPAFLYRGEQPSPSESATLISDFELATRLSYFLWSSTPDKELLACASAGDLQQADVLLAQTRRMLADAKVRRLATEFGCQWLHVRDLDVLDEKSERHFPTFASLRGDMQEETVQFMMDLFQNDRSLTSLLDSDHSFLNPELAKHYGIDLPKEGWQRVDGMQSRGRHGILTLASTLSKHSGASRTSPILRGMWISEVLLGEKLPRPPNDVPALPEETPEGLTERQLTQRHSRDPACAGCHRRIDPFGFALEGFDAIGCSRNTDAAGLRIDTSTTLPDGTQIVGVDGLRDYLLTERRDDFMRQFCNKLLGFALGRSVQLSDKPLVDSMLKTLSENDYRVGLAIGEIVQSQPAFRRVRGQRYEHPMNAQPSQ